MRLEPVRWTMALGAVLLLVTSSHADPLASQRKAAAVLQRAIAAHGGAAGLERARTFSIRATVVNHSIHQSPAPEPPFDTWRDEAWYANDPAKQSFVVDTNRTHRGFHNQYRTVSIRDKGQYIDLLAQTVVIEENLDGLRSLLVRLLPQGILREASSRKATLRSLGKSEDGLHVVSYVRPSGELLTLYLDGQTHLLSRIETLRGDTIDGDVVVVTRYRNYRTKDRLMIPFALDVRRGRWLVSETTFQSVDIGQPLEDGELIARPFRAIASHDPAMELVTVAPNVHVVRYVPDGYNVLCVEFQDHLVVVETPEGNVPSGISQGVIALLKQKFPEKPIRYAVPTHHHSDHVGGVLAHVAEGATIISTEGNRALLDRLMKRTLTLSADAPHGQFAPRFELLFGDSRVLKDSSQELRLYRIGPTPHVNQILIAYLPKERLLFQTDLFNAWSCFRHPVPNEDIGHTTALGDTQALIDAVDRLGLDVKTVYGGHGREVSYTWLKQFTARRAADGKPMWACTAEELLD